MRRMAIGILASVLCGCGANAPAPEDAAFSKAPAPQLPERFHGEPLQHWVQAARSPDAAVRAEAAWGLGELGAGKPSAFEALGPLLDDPAADVRLGALAALQRLGVVPPELTGSVFAAGDREEPAPAALVRALGPLISTDGLSQVLASAPVGSPGFRGAARAAPGRGSVIVTALRPLLQHREAARRQAACEILGALGADASPAIAELVALLPQGAPVGPAASAALGKIGASARPALETFLASDAAKQDAQAALLARLALSRIK